MQMCVFIFCGLLFWAAPVRAKTFKTRAPREAVVFMDSDETQPVLTSKTVNLKNMERRSQESPSDIYPSTRPRRIRAVPVKVPKPLMNVTQGAGLEKDTDDPDGLFRSLEELRPMRPGPGVLRRDQMPVLGKENAGDLRRRRRRESSSTYFPNEKQNTRSGNYSQRESRVSGLSDGSRDSHVTAEMHSAGLSKRVMKDNETVRTLQIEETNVIRDKINVREQQNSSVKFWRKFSIGLKKLAENTPSKRGSSYLSEKVNKGDTFNLTLNQFLDTLPEFNIQKKQTKQKYRNTREVGISYHAEDNKDTPTSLDSDQWWAKRMDYVDVHPRPQTHVIYHVHHTVRAVRDPPTDRKVVVKVTPAANKADNWLRHELLLIELESRALRRKAAQLNEKLRNANINWKLAVPESRSVVLHDVIANGIPHERQGVTETYSKTHDERIDPWTKRIQHTHTMEHRIEKTNYPSQADRIHPARYPPAVVHVQSVRYPPDVIHVQSSHYHPDVVHVQSAQYPSDVVHIHSARYPPDVVHVQSAQYPSDVVHVQSAQYPSDVVHIHSARYPPDVVHVQSAQYPPDVVHVQSAQYPSDVVHVQSAQYPSDVVHIHSARYPPDVVHVQSAQYPSDVVHVQSAQYPPDVVHVQSAQYPPDVVHVQSAQYPPDVIHVQSAQYPPDIVHVQSAGYPPDVHVQSVQYPSDVLHVQSAQYPSDVVHVQSVQYPSDVVHVQSAQYPSDVVHIHSARYPPDVHVQSAQYPPDIVHVQSVPHPPDIVHIQSPPYSSKVVQIQPARYRPEVVHVRSVSYPPEVVRVRSASYPPEVVRVRSASYPPDVVRVRSTSYPPDVVRVRSTSYPPEVVRVRSTSYPPEVVRVRSTSYPPEVVRVRSASYPPEVIRVRSVDYPQEVVHILSSNKWEEASDIVPLINNELSDLNVRLQGSAIPLHYYQYDHKRKKRSIFTFYDSRVPDRYKRHVFTDRAQTDSFNKGHDGNTNERHVISLENRDVKDTNKGHNHRLKSQTYTDTFVYKCTHKKKCSQLHINNLTRWPILIPFNKHIFERGSFQTFPRSINILNIYNIVSTNFIRRSIDSPVGLSRSKVEEHPSKPTNELQPFPGYTVRDQDKVLHFLPLRIKNSFQGRIPEKVVGRKRHFSKQHPVRTDITRWKQDSFTDESLQLLGEKQPNLGKYNNRMKNNHQLKISSNSKFEVLDLNSAAGYRDHFWNLFLKICGQGLVIRYQIHTYDPNNNTTNNKLETVHNSLVYHKKFSKFLDKLLNRNYLKSTISGQFRDEGHSRDLFNIESKIKRNEIVKGEKNQKNSTDLFLYIKQSLERLQHQGTKLPSTPTVPKLTNRAKLPPMTSLFLLLKPSITSNTNLGSEKEPFIFKLNPQLYIKNRPSPLVSFHRKYLQKFQKSSAISDKYLPTKPPESISLKSRLNKNVNIIDNHKSFWNILNDINRVLNRWKTKHNYPELHNPWYRASAPVFINDISLLKENDKKQDGFQPGMANVMFVNLDTSRIKRHVIKRSYKNKPETTREASVSNQLKELLLKFAVPEAELKINPTLERVKNNESSPTGEDSYIEARVLADDQLLSDVEKSENELANFGSRLRREALTQDGEEKLQNWKQNRSLLTRHLLSVKDVPGDRFKSRNKKNLRLAPETNHRAAGAALSSILANILVSENGEIAARQKGLLLTPKQRHQEAEEGIISSRKNSLHSTPVKRHQKHKKDIIFAERNALLLTPIKRNKKLGDDILVVFEENSNIGPGNERQKDEEKIGSVLEEKVDKFNREHLQPVKYFEKSLFPNLKSGLRKDNFYVSKAVRWGLDTGERSNEFVKPEVNNDLEVDQEVDNNGKVISHTVGNNKEAVSGKEMDEDEEGDSYQSSSQVNDQGMSGNNILMAGLTAGGETRLNKGNSQEVSGRLSSGNVNFSENGLPQSGEIRKTAGAYHEIHNILGRFRDNSHDMKLRPSRLAANRNTRHRKHVSTGLKLFPHEKAPNSHTHLHRKAPNKHARLRRQAPNSRTRHHEVTSNSYTQLHREMHNRPTQHRREDSYSHAQLHVKTHNNTAIHYFENHSSAKLHFGNLSRSQLRSEELNTSSQFRPQTIDSSHKLNRRQDVKTLKYLQPHLKNITKVLNEKSDGVDFNETKEFNETDGGDHEAAGSKQNVIVEYFDENSSLDDVSEPDVESGLTDDEPVKSSNVEVEEVEEEGMKLDVKGKKAQPKEEVAFIEKEETKEPSGTLI